MNSVILEKLSKFGKSVSCLYRESGLNKIITKVYNGFSSVWKKSWIASNFTNEGTKKKSVLSKVMYLPVSFIEFLNKKTGRWIKEQIEKSFFLDLIQSFSNNVLALNTRFFGCFLVSNTLVKGIMDGFGIMEAILGVVGLALLLTNINITESFDSSKLIGFCKRLIGVDAQISKIYKKEYTGTLKAFVLAIIFGVATGFIPLIYAILALVGITGVCTVMSYPVVGIFAAIMAAPFVPTMALAGICVLTTVSFLVKALCDTEFTWRREGIGVGFFIFLLLISSLFSFSPAKSLMVWGMYLIFAGFYFVIVNTLRTKEQIYGLLRAFVLLGVVVAVYGILQYVFGWNTTNAWIDKEMFEEATMRAYSTMENPNVLGEYLLLLIPLAAIFMIKKDGRKREKLLFFGILVSSVVCMVLTQSRGCWLGLLLALAIFISFYNGKLWTFVPFLILLIPLVLPEAMMDRLMSVGDMEDSSTSYRVFIWKGTMRMLQDFWIGGIGMGEGAFRTVYPIYSYAGIIAPHSHNTFLQLVVEGGVGVLCVFVGMMILFLKKVAITFRSSAKKSMDSLVSLAIGCGVCGFLLQSMFDYTFYNYRMMAMFFMILAIGVSLKICKGEENDKGN